MAQGPLSFEGPGGLGQVIWGWPTPVVPATGRLGREDGLQPDSSRAAHRTRLHKTKQALGTDRTHAAPAPAEEAPGVLEASMKQAAGRASSGLRQVRGS